MEGKIVQTKYGLIRGRKRGSCTAYLGIPFARPPVGELAFRHPLPPKPWEEILDACHGAANPIQAKGGFVVGNNSQDCLYLNVFVPEKANGPLPVMVWVYGGSYSQGGAGATSEGSDDLEYDLSLFAAETNCIVVTFNYRLNLYGFLNLHYLSRDFDNNNGLYDQIAALQFVKDNIEAFGGDPGNITVFGQSAGGACILALMTMPEAEGLFSKAIVQSACIEHFFTEKESENNTRAYMKYAGADNVKDLLSIPEERIRKANTKYSSWLMRKGDIRCAFSPVIDGVTLREEPKKAVKNSKIPLLIGNTAEEANLFLDPIPAAFLPLVMKIIHVRVNEGDSNYKECAEKALTDHIYVRPQLEILQGYEGFAWRYEYRYVLPESKMGCFHASELPVLFGLNNIFGTEQQHNNAEQNKVHPHR